MKQFVIAHGLPGSGKSTLLKKLANEKLKAEEEAEYLDLDKYSDKQDLDSSLRDERLISSFDKKWFGFDTTKAVVYIDSLSLTNNDLAELIYAVMRQYAFMVDDKTFQFEILDFEGDRELCIKNDMIRSFTNHSRSAKNTIENEKFEEVDVDLIGSIVGEKMATRDFSFNCGFTIKVKKVPVWDSDNASTYERIKALVYAAADNFGVVNDNMMQGESWITGGREWSYTGKEWSVSGETPKDFDSFDDMMGVLCSNISFLNYKKIRSECCIVEEYNDNDYYHSYTKNRWVCNLDKLTGMLESLGITI